MMFTFVEINDRNDIFCFTKNAPTVDMCLTPLGQRKKNYIYNYYYYNNIYNNNKENTLQNLKAVLFTNMLFYLILSTKLLPSLSQSHLD